MSLFNAVAVHVFCLAALTTCGGEVDYGGGSSSACQMALRHVTDCRMHWKYRPACEPSDCDANCLLAASCAALSGQDEDGQRIFEDCESV
jgi:hypothetical protein